MNAFMVHADTGESILTSGDSPEAAARSAASALDAAAVNGPVMEKGGRYEVGGRSLRVEEVKP